MTKGPTDYNDIATTHGKEAVSKQLDQDLQALDETYQSDEPVPEYMDDGPPPESQQPNAAREKVEWRHLFDKTDKGAVKASPKNVQLVLTNDERWQGVLAFCEFSYRVMKLKSPPTVSGRDGEWDDADPALTRIWMAYNYNFTPSKDDIHDALIYTAKCNRYHPVRDYLESLVWDSKPRLNTWLAKAFESTENKRYLELIGPMILIGSVARIIKPGCQMDNVTILEGKQGKGKSTAIRILFGDWFTDAPLPIGDKDAYQVIQGKWGCEVAELDSFHKAEVTTLKRFFTQQIDRFRPSYGRVAQDHPRQTIFFGTTNNDVYLRDYTGNRRYWPLYCVTVNKDWLKENRDQLWAEALHRYRQKEQYWIDPESLDDAELMEIVEKTQDARRQEDPWENRIIDYLKGKEGEYLHISDILLHACKRDIGVQNQADMNRVGPILKSIGWKNGVKRIPEDGKLVQRRIWLNIEAEKKKKEVPLDE